MDERILVIDDDDGSREAVCSLLEIEGYEPICACDGQEGLKQLAQNPRLIICDLMMPVMDGWKFRAEQKRHANYAKIPFFVISAVPSPNVNADAVFTKPLDAAAFLALIKKYLATREGRITRLLR